MSSSNSSPELWTCPLGVFYRLPQTMSPGSIMATKAFLTQATCHAATTAQNEWKCRTIAKLRLHATALIVSWGRLRWNGRPEGRNWMRGIFPDQFSRCIRWLTHAVHTAFQDLISNGGNVQVNRILWDTCWMSSLNRSLQLHGKHREVSEIK